MQWLTGFFDKSGALGSIVAAMGCASCFPALSSLAASLGLGFLTQFEGLFINTLLPEFAWLVLIINVIAFVSHRRWCRLFAGLAGPVMVLLTLYPLWSYGWSTYLFYAGLISMFIVSMWDLVSTSTKQYQMTAH